jgi:NO-binding membrane sensor protein with MHYT domain
MFRVLTCLNDAHDLRLVALAGSICLIASFTAVTLLRHAAAAVGRLQAVWIAVASVATGFGI